MNLVRTIDLAIIQLTLLTWKGILLIEVINDYRITPKTREALLLCKCFGRRKVSAWEIIGPYGMGKSSFLNYLVTVAASFNNNTATKIALDSLSK